MSAAAVMKWSSALSRAEDLDRAIAETAEATLATLGASPDLVFLFASEHHRERFGSLPAQVKLRLNCGALLGCSASGVIGGGEEIEQQPALALTACRLPGVDLECWHLEADALAPGTTRVRRFTSRFSLSSGLVDQILRQCASGKAVKAIRSASASSSISATGACCARNVSTTRAN